MRSLLANRQDFRAHLERDDILMIPDLPENVGVMDWHQSSLLMNCSYEWTAKEITRFRATGDPVLGRIDHLLGR